MMPRAFAYAESAPLNDAERTRDGQLICVGIMLTAVCFNFVLAVINRNVKPLSPFDVILAEIAIVGIAHILCLFRFRDLMLPWYLLFWFMVMVGFARWLWLADIDPKSIRD